MLLAALLEDDDWVGEPLGVTHLTDDSIFLQFAYLLDVKSCFSGAWRRAFCLMGCALDHTSKWCSITSLGPSDKSDAF